MRELRFDPLSDAWVLIAPNRATRPGSDRHRRRSRPWPAPDWVASCPFCPGNEHLTPPEIAREVATPGEPAWQARAFPNRYPILDSGLSEPIEPGVDAGQLLRSRRSGGAHEVVVLSPRHDAALATMLPEEAATALRMLQERTRFHLAAGRPYVQVFLNHDPAAGASIDHPHAQVVAMDVVPPLLEREAAVLSGDGCLLCRAIQDECLPGAPRAILSSDVVTWCPYWSSAAYELIVAPRTHRGRFQEAVDDLDLAGPLVRVLACLDHAASDPAYNLVVHSAPAATPDFHWHLHVRPRLSELGGFEMGSGIAVVELAPEDAAHALREASRQGPQS